MVEAEVNTMLNTVQLNPPYVMFDYHFNQAMCYFLALFIHSYVDYNLL